MEDKVGKNTQKEQEKEKRLRKNEGLREMQNNWKRNNIHIVGVPEREEEQGTENLFEKVIMKNFLNFMREKVVQV